MGCNIHMFCEVFSKVLNKWETVGAVFKNNCYRPERLPTISDGEDSFSPFTLHPFQNRNYTLFTILAGVRSEGNLPIISEPRRLPKDVSPYVQRRSDEYDSDGHSHSFLTLAELEKFDWKPYLSDSNMAFFALHVLQSLRKLKRFGEVRIVFWFDN